MMSAERDDSGATPRRTEGGSDRGSAGRRGPQGAARGKGPPRGGRRRSRELAVQGVYQWLVNVSAPGDLLRQLQEDENFAQADAAYLDTLLRGTLADAEALRDKLVPHLDRDVRQLSPVEHAILLVGAYELSACLDVPYRVVINEAVEVAKLFGGTDGHKFVNGVLDRLAPELRPHEGARGGARP